MNIKREKESNYILSESEEDSNLFNYLKKNLYNHTQLSSMLNQQIMQRKMLLRQQQTINQEIASVEKVVSNIRDKEQWSDFSSIPGESLRYQISQLPSLPKSQQIDTDLTELRLQRQGLEEQLELIRSALLTIKSDSTLTESIQQRYEQRLKMFRDILSSLLSDNNSLVLQFTKLKASNQQLIDAFNNVQEESKRYLFWIPDLPPFGINISGRLNDILENISLHSIYQQLAESVISALTEKKYNLLILFTAILIVTHIILRRSYHNYLIKTAEKIGKVNQDKFSTTLFVLFLTLLTSLPIPLIFSTIAYILQHAPQYPIAVTLGKSITVILPLLSGIIFCNRLATPNNIFIKHFQWPEKKVAKVFRYSHFLLWGVIPPLILLNSFNHSNDLDFITTLQRLCFMVICITVLIVTFWLKQVKIPLYLNNEGSADNTINALIWWVLLSAPLLSLLSAILGYLSTAQALLFRLESSISLWLASLLVYHLIRRLMLIQKRKIAFERARQRRIEILNQRTRTEDENNYNQLDDVIEIEEPVVNLDIISAQSLRLVRSLLTMITTVLLIIIWSDIHSAFDFLRKIPLWEVYNNVQGVDVPELITLASLLAAILVVMITVQLVRNLPSLLDLAVLPHLKLSHGTGYALTALTRYVVSLVGSIVIFSLLGIEWSKLQWLVAALGVGLGFGLQEIFANFISGLIVLFEKPIRIGDTVTIRNLTGSITRINTRATTLVDSDRKEIIVPNKAFITEQFTNWSLSDSITRIVLVIPAPTEIKSDIVSELLLQAARSCTLSLETPAPAVYLTDIQKGIQLFELRVYASDLSHRMTIQHEVYKNILTIFDENGLVLPYPLINNYKQ